MRRFLLLLAPALLVAAACVTSSSSGLVAATSCPGAAVCFPGGFGGRIVVGSTQVYAGSNGLVTFNSGFGVAIYVGGTRVYNPGGGTTTTTVAATTTSSAATTTTAGPTTTTTPASTTTAPSGGPACGLAAAAFCETFDTPHNGGTQTGDLDPVLWGVSRLAEINPNQKNNAVAVAHLAGCGPAVASPPPADVRICGGKMFEAVNDGGNVVNLNTYPKQPFNFAGRTGKVVFDVSADSDGTHGAWPEFLITDKPVPGARTSISAQNPPHALNEIGFELDGCDSGPGGNTGVGPVYWTVNGVFNSAQTSRPNCITKGSFGAMNHFEVRLSQTHIDVFGTDAGASTLKLLASENVPLAFTQGLVWLNDVHYNARKAVEPCGCGTQFDHTFAWDNLGFDGPKTYRDLGFDVPLANQPNGTSPNGDPEIDEGYLVGLGPRTFTVQGVNWAQTPTAAQVVMNVYSFDPVAPSVSVNGRPYVNVAWRADDSTFAWRSLSVPIPFGDVVSGTNTIAIKSASGSTVVANATLILVNAAPVP